MAKTLQSIFGHGTQRAGLALMGVGALATPLLLWGAPAIGQGTPAKAAVKAEAKPDAKKQKTTELGEIVVKSDRFDYDTANRRVTFSGNVDLVSKESHLTSDTMAVDLTEDNQIKLAHCVGKVVVEKKNEDGTMMIARSQILDYSETGQTANLYRNVDVLQGAKGLVKPAHIVGDKVDMDLAKKVNVVYGTPTVQATVHIEPKGQDGKPAPEPVDLTADRIEMQQETQNYIATGKPVMQRPSSKLVAKTIKFNVDQKTNEIQKAYADDDVVVDSRSEDGTLMHATGDKGVFSKETNEVTMDGNVIAETRKATDQEPTVYQGDHYVYNTKTKISTMAGNASVKIPKAPTKPADPNAKPGDKNPADKKKETEKKDGAK